MVNENLNQFQITVYGKSEKYSETISKNRCRVFYKGLNRNGSYITEEFAQKLIGTAPYAPIKGIYDSQDYTDHGENRSEGRIYGVIPAEPNFAWETHLDDDGKEREYACFDVLLYTALYSEAGEIAGKAQSMELYKPSVKGRWQFVSGKRSFVYDDGCFLGLQVLGDNVEPCFEGAAFFSLCKTLDEQNVENSDIFQDNGEGGRPMLNFKISDSQKHEALWSLLNPNYNAEGNWLIEYSICDIYDDYALVRNYADGTFERAYYTKNNENDSIEITKKEVCHIVDITESEKNALNTIRLINGNTFEAIDEKFNSITEENSQFNTKVEELNSEIATLTTERDQANSALEIANTNYASVQQDCEAAVASYEAANATIATLTEERDALIAYKKDIEDTEKRNIIAGYVDQLSEEVITSYTNNMDNYTAEQLDKDLTYELKKVNPTVFAKTPAPAIVRIPKVEEPQGLEAILARYKNN